MDAMPEKLLGSTARWTASVRALESKRPDRLLDDPWAADLAGNEGQVWLAQRTPEAVLPIIIRTRFFDDFLQRITSEFGIRQVVLMAAGMDTRAFRLEWPQGTKLFELDQADVLYIKDRILKTTGARPVCERFTITADLTAIWIEALIKSGFDAKVPALWLLEGFLFYLPSELVTHILKEISQFAINGSWMGFDIINNSMLVHPMTKNWIEMQASSGAPWIGTLDNPVDFLTELGWKASLSQAGQPDANYGRWSFPVLPTNMPDIPHNWFVTAQKLV